MKRHILTYPVSIAVILCIAATIIAMLQQSHRRSSLSPKDGAEIVVTEPVGTLPEPIDKQSIRDLYGKLPINFEPNVGQTDDAVRFLARGQGYSLFLSQQQAVLTLQRHGKSGKVESQSAVRMGIEGSNESATIAGEDLREGRSNYFIGSDPEKWRTDVPNFQKVKYKSIYDGVDLVYYGNGQKLEYDFVVGPGQDPKKIKLTFEGVESAKIDKRSGDLLLGTGSGSLRQLKPIVYQDTETGRNEIASTYSLKKEADRFTVSFNIAHYDDTKELIIDPVLAYGSYLGGNAFDEGRSITVDSAGNAYVVGTAASQDFPTTPGTIKPVLLPRTDAPNSFWYDAFVTKINPTGTALVFSTYFGGRNGNESGSGVALDASGNVLIAGTTMSGDLPTVNAFQATFGGTDDAFAAKLNPTGSAIIFSTYLGGNNTDLGGSVAINQTTGDAVFAGFAGSGNFPTTSGAYKPQLCTNIPGSCNGIFYSGAYIVKLTATGGIVYSTLFDAGINDVALDAADNALIVGTANAGAPTTPGAFQPTSSGGIEGYIAKMNPAGNALVFATFLGGGLQSDRVKAVVLDTEQNIYVTGQTQNTAFPTTPGALDTTFNGGEDGFVTKFNPQGSALVFSTFLGGAGKDESFAIGLAANRDVFVAGETLSNASFPLRNPLLQTGSIFLTRLRADGTALEFSTFLGTGGAYDLATDSASNAYITGHTTNVLVTPSAFQTVRGGGDVSSSAKDAFVLKIAPSDENVQMYSISGTVTDQNYGYNNNYAPIVATLTGSVNRTISLPYSSNGISNFQFGSLPAGGNYVISVRKIGFATEPESVPFSNLGANQFADFTLLRNREPVAVITSPAHGTQFNVGSSVSIQATASDPDGHAISKVDFIAYSSATGSVPLGTDTTAPFEFTWNNLPLGTWSINAIPTDELGLRGISTPVVHIFVVDPTGANVSITSPADGQTFIEGGYVPISVNVSSSVNVVEVRDQNNNLVGRMTSSPWSTQWRVMQTGSYTLTANAFTQTGQQASSAPVNITVNPINHRISGRVIDNISSTGIAGVTVNLTSPTNANITAQTVTDSNGAYLFTGLGTTPNDGVVITPQLAGYTVDPANRSIAYLGYIDWDTQNFWATPQTQITVTMTSPNNGQEFTAPATINLAAAATSAAGAITKVDFFRRDNNGSTTLLGTDATSPYESQLSGVAVGTYTYFARATDATNGVADSDNVGITVVLPTVSFSGRITGPTGSGVSGVTVYIAGFRAWTEDTDANGNFTFANYPGGHDYYITPYPQNNTTFTPTSRSYTNVLTNVSGVDFVASAPNSPPTIQLISPTQGGVYTMPAPIPIDVVASDPDNNINRVRVLANNGRFLQTIVQTTNTTVNTTWQPAEPGVYEITADVRDAFNVTVSQQITITVNPPGPVSISGRVVDRSSVGIEEVALELRNYPGQENVIGTATTDANGNYTIQNVTTFQSYILRASKLDYAFSPQQRLYLNLAGSQANADYTGTLQLQPADFDGDGESDFAVWRPSSGVWHITRSIDQSYSANQFGGGQFGDIVVPGNYDGDRRTDQGVFRNGIWYIQNSSNGTVRITQFGLAGDKPVQGDYDGDGKTDIAVWRESNNVWYVLRSGDGGFSAYQFGSAGDRALAGDYDGDGKFDYAIFRPSTGTWYIFQTGTGQVMIANFGLNGDTPLVGDFDGDKRADLSVFRPSTGVWYYLYSSNGSFGYRTWGVADDKPVPGDYDHDGKTDVAVFRESDGNWYVFFSGSGSYTIRHFGSAGDIPIPAAYIR
ncbi:MAG: Ig-like domain-containing protein [Pyrinomonadaceae bacterium]